MAHKSQTASGKRSQIQGSGQPSGCVVGTTRPQQRPLRDISILATLRAAALRRVHSTDTIDSFSVQPEDVRVRVRRAPTGNLVIFVVDASGSMGARKRMRLVKEAMLGLLLEAYQGRDRVSLIAFRGQGAEVLVPPTNSVDVAERQLRTLPTGGRTPLAAALQTTLVLLRQHQRCGAGLEPLVVLVTDGRHNQGPSPTGVARLLAARDVPILVLDSEDGFVRLGQARELAEALGAGLLPLDVLGDGRGRRGASGGALHAGRGARKTSVE